MRILLRLPGSHLGVVGAKSSSIEAAVAEAGPGTELDSKPDFQGIRNAGGIHAVLSTLFLS